MIQKIYVVFDKVAEESGPPFVSVNDGVAVRSYAKIMSQVADPNDYALLCIGDFNTETAAIAPVSPVRVVNVRLDKERMFAVIEGGENDVQDI